MTAHAAHGRKRIESVEVGPITGGDSLKSFDCDLLVMAVGFKPQINLLSMGNKPPKWDAERQILRVSELPSGVFSAGEVHGSAGFERLYAEGFHSGKEAASSLTSPGKVYSIQTERTSEENSNPSSIKIIIASNEFITVKTVSNKASLSS